MLVAVARTLRKSAIRPVGESLRRIARYSNSSSQSCQSAADSTLSAALAAGNFTTIEPKFKAASGSTRSDNTEFMVECTIGDRTEIPMKTLIAKVKKSISRGGQTSLRHRVGYGTALVRQSFHGLLDLRGCDKVGFGARVAGHRPSIQNSGKITIGTFLNLSCEIAPICFRTGAAGTIEIGDSVFMNFGSIVTANNRVSIGHHALIGPYSLISDTECANQPRDEEGLAIEIGDYAWLAAHVTVLPGARIGARSVIKAGSVVAGYIPPDVVAGGIPARVLRQLKPHRTEHRNEISNSHNKARSSSSAVTEISSKKSSRMDEVLSESTNSSCKIVSDFSLSPLVRFLNQGELRAPLDFCEVPYDQDAAWSNAEGDESRLLLLWCRPERVLPEFARALHFEAISDQELLKQVDEFANLVKRAASAHRGVVLPTWALARRYRHPSTPGSNPGNLSRILTMINSRLMTNLDRTPTVRILNAQSWLEYAGRTAMHPMLHFAQECPFHSEVLYAASRDIQVTLLEMLGLQRRLLILELNDVIWGGTLSDSSWTELQLGGESSEGRAFSEFQSLLLSFRREGVLLAIASKNDEAAVMSAIDHLDGMKLNAEHLAGRRINWGDKAVNILDLTRELGVGLNETLYIDANPNERSRVRKALPTVLVPEWPSDVHLFTESLLELGPILANTARNVGENRSVISHNGVVE